MPLPVPVSFEIYPPKTAEQRGQLDRALGKLMPFAPEFVSCTYGAGGSTQAFTADTVAAVRTTHGIDCAPHLTCIGSRREELLTLLQRYREQGCRRIVALRGDLPSGTLDNGELHHAAELVALIRAHFGDAFHIEVAAYPETHPQAGSYAEDLQHFVAKMRAGADSAITQYFYDADAYFRFVDDARRLGVEAPIVPGIMPIANFSQLLRFSKGCGAQIPRWVEQRMATLADKSGAARELAADIVANLCQRLVAGGAPALHFYTLNLANPTRHVLRRLSGQP